MERSSRVLQLENPKILFYFSKKFEVGKIEFCPYPEFPSAEKRNVSLRYISNWYFNGKIFTGTTAWEQKLFFPKKFKIEIDLYFDLC